jgi:hypothetical protein
LPYRCPKALIQDDIHPRGAPEAHDGCVEQKHLAEGRGHLPKNTAAVPTTNIPSGYVKIAIENDHL